MSKRSGGRRQAHLQVKGRIVGHPFRELWVNGKPTGGCADCRNVWYGPGEHASAQARNTVKR